MRTRLIRAYVFFETTNSNGRIVSSTSCVGQTCPVSSFDTISSATDRTCVERCRVEVLVRSTDGRDRLARKKGEERLLALVDAVLVWESRK